MTAEQPSPLGALLLRTRKRADLTQEALAERAGVSANTVSNLEAGRGHLPRQATLELLVEALAGTLGLDPAERSALGAAFREAAGASRAVRRDPDSDRPAQRSAPPIPPLPPALPAGTLVFLVGAPVSEQVPRDHLPPGTIPRLAGLLQRLVPPHGGHLVDPPEGPDGAVCVFTSPDRALSAACALQQVLADGTPVPVGLALHAGWAEPGDGGYAGATRLHAVRLARLGHAGQLLLTQAMRDRLGGAVPEGVRLQDVGRHSLSAVERPAPLYQILPAGRPARFPPLRPPQAPPTNLPVQATSFVGREREQAVAIALLRQAPLLTLTGSGGCGKTRLALQTAADLLEDYPDGAWLVELAAIVDPALVPQAVATALRVREEPERPLAATLLEALRSKRLLLLLDNCEHLLAACADLAATLLARCPYLQVLATSRERLGIRGEVVYRVPSLSLPGPVPCLSVAELAACEAVQLFVERARAARPAFALDAGNADAVARICARLDGIPLALELAASRVGSLLPETIAARLEECLGLLTGGPRDVLPRHRTLRAALDWGWDLLGEQEQMLLRRLAVFAGGWTLGATVAVCCGEGVTDWAVPDLLADLVGKSLLALDEGGARARYSMLETVREYVTERLAVSEREAAVVRDRHLHWCLALAGEAEPRLAGSEQVAWLDRLEAEHDNMRAALSWSVRDGGDDSVLGLRLAGALWRFWHARGYMSEGRRWLDAVLAACGGGPAACRARVLTGAGVLAGQQGDHAPAVTLFEEALALWRELGDRQGITLALHNMGVVFRMEGDYVRAAALFEEVLALRRVMEDRQGIGLALNNLGLVAYRLGDSQRAASLHEEALRLQRELGDTRRIAGSLGNLGNVAHQAGDPERAVTLHEEALVSQRALGDSIGIATSLINLAAAVFDTTDYTRAAILLREAFLLGRDLGARDLLSEGLEIASWLAAVERPRTAAQLGGASEALCATLGLSLPRWYRIAHERAVLTMRAALGEEAHAVAWAEGQALALEEAVDLALAKSTNERGE